MELLSVRSLVILLAFACVLITAALCTGLAVDSGDRALSSTKDACSQQLNVTEVSGKNALSAISGVMDDSVAASFQAGSDGVTKITHEIILGTLGSVGNNLIANFKVLQTMVWSNQDFLLGRSRKVSVVSDAFTDELGTRLYSDTKRNQHLGVYGFNFMMKNNKAIGFSENAETAERPPDEFHHVTRFQCFGPANSCRTGTVVDDFGAWNATPDAAHDTRLPDGRYEDPSCRTPAETSPLTGRPCNVFARPGCRKGMAIPTDGRIDSGSCPVIGVEPANSGLPRFMYATMTHERPRWTALSSFNAIVITMLAVLIRVEGEVVGVTTMMVLTTSLSRLLRSVKIGGGGAVTRLFLTVGRHWMTVYGADDHEGAAHGTSVSYAGKYAIGKRNDQTVGITLAPVWAGLAADPIIRWAGRSFGNRTGKYYSEFVGAVSVMEVDSDLAGGGGVELLPSQGDAIVNTTYRYLNGYRTEAEKDLPPLPNYAASGTKFFVSVADIPLGVDGGDGNWYLTMMIDYEYVLGEIERARASTEASILTEKAAVVRSVDEAAARTAAAIKKSNDDVQSEQDTDRIVLYCVVAGSAVMLIVAAVVMVSLIIAPIEQLKADMSEVAVMKLENVDEERPPSKLSEVGQMQVSFKQMIKNLREYRSYMPASVLVDDDEEEEGEGEGASKLEESAVSGNSRKDSQNSHPSRAGKSKESAVSMASRVEECGQRTGLSLNRKKVAFVTFNVADFSSRASKMGAHTTIDVIAKYLSSLVTVSQQMRGLVDGFNVDRLYVTFNALRSCASPGCAAAVAACSGVVQANAALEKATKDKGLLVVRAACAMGECMNGNIGTDTMKKFCCIGTAAGLVHVIHRGHDIWGTDACSSDPVALEAKARVHTRLLLPLEFKGDTQRLYELCGLKKVSEEEWMYQLGDAEKDDPYSGFNEAIEHFYQGDSAHAKEALTALKERFPERCTVAMERIEKVV